MRRLYTIHRIQSLAISIQNSDGNTIIAPDRFLRECNGTVRFSGTGGTLRIGDDCNCHEIGFTVGQGCTVEVGAGSWLANLNIFTETSSRVVIGRGAAFTWQTHISCHEPFDVIIGEDCLFASNTSIAVSDMHSVIDIATGSRINPGADVTIGDRVWMASHASIMKGVSIGSGSIVAMGAIVNKSAPDNCVIAGVPAKVVKRGVTWDRSLLPVIGSDQVPMISKLPKPTLMSKLMQLPRLFRAQH